MSPAATRVGRAAAQSALRREAMASIATATTTAAAGDADRDLAPDTLRRMYEEMLLTRLLDERMLQLNRIGKAPFVISCQGQEAAQIGAAFALDTAKDWFLPYYRDLAICIHAGMTAREIMLNLFAKPDDPNSGGRQMPGHYGSRRLRIVTGSSPVATQLVHATGVAYAAKLRGEDVVAYTSVGEGGTSTGEFHEALNFAAIHKLAVLFFVENNQYAISVPQAKQMAVANVADKAPGYGMPGAIVDGNDVFAVYRTVREAVGRARRGEGPTLVEAKCARFQPHSGDDDDRYRTREAIAALRERDPVVLFRRALEERGLLDAARVEELAARLRAEIDEATDFGEAAPDVDPATLDHHVYAKGE
jgi:2-oxoisovalerate dehydrogenase E1 component alpha subunit